MSLNWIELDLGMKSPSRSPRQPQAPINSEACHPDYQSPSFPIYFGGRTFHIFHPFQISTSRINPTPKLSVTTTMTLTSDLKINLTSISPTLRIMRRMVEHH